MARQAGPIFLEGTLDDITFYKMDGVYYARMKSRLTRGRVLKSPRFALTRMHANQLAEASRIASLVYRQIPKEEKSIKLFRSIVGKAKVMLSEGKEKEEVLEALLIKEGFEYRTRNKEQMKFEGKAQCSMFNAQFSTERSKVKGNHSIEVRKEGNVEKVVKRSGSLLVNEVGRLINKFYKPGNLLYQNHLD